MAALAAPHWEAVPPATRRLLGAIASFPLSSQFYLAGGTALALREGHRMSRDLDFFSETDQVDSATRAEILTHLRQSFSEVAPVTDVRGDLTVTVDGQRAGFYSYGYQLLEAGDELLSMRIAGMLDIAAMKLDAVAGRGARRDFYDLYILAQWMPLEALLERAQTKYPQSRDFPMMIVTYLNDFRNADRDRPVETLRPIAWQDVKDFFLSEARRLAELWYLPPDEAE